MDRIATSADWRTRPMPDAHAQFSFRRSFSDAQMERLKCGHIPKEMEDKWFWYFEENRMHIHRSWTGICIFIVEFTPGSDELRVMVNRDPAKYREEDADEDKHMLNVLLDWWAGANYDPYTHFLSDTSRKLERLKVRPNREERIIGCICGGAVGDALGYGVEFLSLAQIREKYGPEGIQYYDLKNGEARFSDDTQMLLFTQEGIYMWEEAIRKEPTTKLKTCLYRAYRDWLYTQEGDSPQKEKHKACTQLYLVPEMHKRRGPGFTCLRSLRQKRAGSIENPLNDSKGNGGVMRVAPIGYSFSRSEYSLEQVVCMGAECAAITHGHPLGYISAGLMVGLVNECVYGEPESLADAVRTAGRAVEKTFGQVPCTRELLDLVERAIDLASQDRDDPEVIASLGENSGCAETALAAAIYCALKHEDDFSRAIIAAVNIDGDSDTVASIAGNILGTWKGGRCISNKWITPLHMERYLKALQFYKS